MPMTTARCLPLFLVLAACGEVMPSHPDAGAAPDGGAPDAAPLTCDPTAPFDPPVPVEGFTAAQGTVRLTADERTAVFQDTSAGYELYIADRDAIGEPFGGAVPLTSVNSADADFDPTLTGDGLRLIFTSGRAGDGSHLYVATRATTSSPFGAPSLLTDVMAPTGTSDDAHGYQRPDGMEVWFSSMRAGNVGARDLYRAAASGSGFSAAEQVLAIESSDDDMLPVVSADGMAIYFASSRPGGAGGLDIWTARRSTPGGSFGAPVPVTELSTAGTDFPTWMSLDGCRLYLSRDYAVVVAERHPG
jgi:hypothetical protein